MRPKTLPAAFVPVCLGSALAWQAGAWQWLPALVCLLFALLIQIGANFANDYFDFIKGADHAGRQGPARAVASGWIRPPAMLRATITVFAAALAIGMLLTWYGGLWLIGIGLLCVLCGLAYTGGPYPLGYHGWGDLFVLVFFGLVAVGCTYYVQVGAFVLPASLALPGWVRMLAVWGCGLYAGALATSLLAVNNHRDARSDAAAGKRTLAVRYGRSFVLGEYTVMTLGALAWPIILWRGGYTVGILLPLALLPLVSVLIRDLGRATDAAAYSRILTGTAGFMLAAGLLLSAGILLQPSA
jgi:1,4-dihydroxy-2-naphthoate octaprenyltransferase